MRILSSIHVYVHAYVHVHINLLLLLILTNYQKRYKRIQIKLTTLHNNKRTNIELFTQGCVDYNTILASQMLLINILKQYFDEIFKIFLSFLAKT